MPLDPSNPTPHGPPVGPLHIDAVTVPGGAQIGMCHCPGRRGLDGKGLLWQRRLEDDVAAIADWGARLVLTLIEDHEFDRFGVRGLPEAVQARQLQWAHYPIADMQPPRFRTFETSGSVGREVVRLLREGQPVLIHCAAGLGRTGTLAARLLVEFGLGPQEAIARVRQARPGTLETAEQEAFVARMD